MVNETLLTKFIVFLCDEKLPFSWLEEDCKTKLDLSVIFSKKIEEEIMLFSKNKSFKIFYVLVNPNVSVLYVFIDNGEKIEMQFSYFYENPIRIESFISMFDFLKLNKKEENKADEELKTAYEEIKEDSFEDDPVSLAVDMVNKNVLG